jgi:hypothetical protein
VHNRIFQKYSIFPNKESARSVKKSKSPQVINIKINSEHNPLEEAPFSFSRSSEQDLLKEESSIMWSLDLGK